MEEIKEEKVEKKVRKTKKEKVDTIEKVEAEFEEIDKVELSEHELFVTENIPLTSLKLGTIINSRDYLSNYGMHGETILFDVKVRSDYDYIPFIGKSEINALANNQEDIMKMFNVSNGKGEKMMGHALNELRQDTISNIENEIANGVNELDVKDAKFNNIAKDLSKAFITVQEEFNKKKEKSEEEISKFERTGQTLYAIIKNIYLVRDEYNVIVELSREKLKPLITRLINCRRELKELGDTFSPLVSSVNELINEIELFDKTPKEKIHRILNLTGRTNIAIDNIKVFHDIISSVRQRSYLNEEFNIATTFPNIVNYIIDGINANTFKNDKEITMNDIETKGFTHSIITSLDFEKIKDIELNLKSFDRDDHIDKTLVEILKTIDAPSKIFQDNIKDGDDLINKISTFINAEKSFGYSKKFHEILELKKQSLEKRKDVSDEEYEAQLKDANDFQRFYMVKHLFEDEEQSENELVKEAKEFFSKLSPEYEKNLTDNFSKILKLDEFTKNERLTKEELKNHPEEELKHFDLILMEKLQNEMLEKITNMDEEQSMLVIDIMKKSICDSLIELYRSYPKTDISVGGLFYPFFDKEFYDVGVLSGLLSSLMTLIDTRYNNLFKVNAEGIPTKANIEYISKHCYYDLEKVSFNNLPIDIILKETYLMKTKLFAFYNMTLVFMYNIDYKGRTDLNEEEEVFRNTIIENTLPSLVNMFLSNSLLERPLAIANSVKEILHSKIQNKEHNKDTMYHMRTEIEQFLHFVKAINSESLYISLSNYKKDFDEDLVNATFNKIKEEEIEFFNKYLDDFPEDLVSLDFDYSRPDDIFTKVIIEEENKTEGEEILEKLPEEVVEEIKKEKPNPKDSLLFKLLTKKSEIINRIDSVTNIYSNPRNIKVELTEEHFNLFKELYDVDLELNELKLKTLIIERDKYIKYVEQVSFSFPEEYSNPGSIVDVLDQHKSFKKFNHLTHTLYKIDSAIDLYREINYYINSNIQK